MSEPTRLAFLTDAGFLRPTLVAMASALDSATQPVEAHLVGWKLDDAARAMAMRVAAGWPQHKLVLHDLEPEWLAEATTPKSTIPANALGKLFLPRLIEGRFLYLDGDILISHDLSQAMRLDLGDNLLAGVPDYVVSKWAAQKRTDQLEGLRRVLGDVAPVTYVNSGVLLFDGDAIRQDGALLAQMADLKAARGFGTVDQDRINQIFAGRIASLDPAWNASWGRLSAHRRNICEGGGTVLARPEGHAMVLHFHGPGKPWQTLGLKTAAKGILAILAYRTFLRRYARKFPDLRPI